MAIGTDGFQTRVQKKVPGLSSLHATALVFLPFAAGYYLSYFCRTINALISSALVSEFQLSAAELGFLTSVYFLSAVVQLPLGAMVDRFGPRHVRAFSCLLPPAGLFCLQPVPIFGHSCSGAC